MQAQSERMLQIEDEIRSLSQNERDYRQAIKCLDADIKMLLERQRRLNKSLSATSAKKEALEVELKEAKREIKVLKPYNGPGTKKPTQNARKMDIGSLNVEQLEALIAKVKEAANG